MHQEDCIHGVIVFSRAAINILVSDTDTQHSWYLCIHCNSCCFYTYFWVALPVKGFNLILTLAHVPPCPKISKLPFDHYKVSGCHIRPYSKNHDTFELSQMSLNITALHTLFDIQLNASTDIMVQSDGLKI